MAIFVSCTQPKKENRKVIVVHARGISYPEMQEYLTATKSDLFFKRNEKNITKLTPITNAVTISNIASFETGESPSEHGIVGHLYVKKENEKLSLVSGFSQPFETETFWEKADLKGKKVLNIGSLTLHGKYITHKNVDALSQGTQIGKPIILELKQISSNDNSLVKYRNSNDEFKIPELQNLVVYKTKDSQLIFDNDYNFDNGFVKEATLGNWFELDNNLKGKWLNKSSDSIQIYVRPQYKNKGYPKEFIQSINENIGNPTGWPNIGYYTSKKIDSKTLLEEIYSELNHIMKVFTSTSQKKEYDLIMIDYPLMDRIGHSFLGLKKSSKEIQLEYKNAFSQMDKDFNTIEAFAKKNNYDLIITSGHGFSPIHTSIDINKFLTKNSVNTNFNSKDWEAIGIPAKVSSHIYINDNLSIENKQKTLKKIEDAFSYLKYKDELVVDEIYRREDLNKIGLDHKNSGDLFVLLNPGYLFENNSNEKTFWGVPKFRGDHGYSLKHKESYGIFISKIKCHDCHSIDISKTIEKRLFTDYSSN
ncbi:hypothetical protein WH52_12260 [Tenacibaculum holothuriorum]|uniref:Nucleotide pyrophosphatase n=1 Tax=Tenacibaculum holothuriorum TaxID=1635173 RepID=A0A1Y2PAQ1_9FLAO|nr:hypothetical protein WH52_12260 [Tenacibaculum holothuriorum]